MTHLPRFFDRWSIRGVLVFAIEVMALSSLWLRDLVLAAMLQGLAVLVLSVHQLDRRLPSVLDTGEDACAPRDDLPEQGAEAPDKPPRARFVQQSENASFHRPNRSA